MGKYVRSNLILRFFLLFVLLVGTSCALTLKQEVLYIRRDWDSVREQVLVAIDKGKLPKEAKKEFIIADATFTKVYNKVKDALLKNGDVTEVDLKFLRDLTSAWQGRVPK